MVVITTTTTTYSLYVMGVTMLRPKKRGGYVMGVQASIRYAIAWLLTNVVVRVFSWLITLFTWIALLVGMFAFWFSPEHKAREYKRALEALTGSPEDDD